MQSKFLTLVLAAVAGLSLYYVVDAESKDKPDLTDVIKGLETHESAIYTLAQAVKLLTEKESLRTEKEKTK